MLGNSIEYGSKFSHKPMQDIASFARTMNMATQAVAKADADLQDTGTGAAVINGVHHTAVQDASLDISGDLQFTIWLTATAYTAVDCRYVEDSNGHKQWYQCIASHTSAAGTKPGQKDSENATWRTYWTESTNRCVQASGHVVADTYSQYYLVLKTVAGVNTTVLAGDTALDAAVALEIPAFDPERFVAIAVILLNSGGNTWGTTDDNAIVTITQLIGPVFPTGLGIDPN